MKPMFISCFFFAITVTADAVAVEKEAGWCMGSIGAVQLQLREEGLRKLLLSNPAFVKRDLVAKSSAAAKKYGKWEVVKNQCASSHSDSEPAALKCLDDGIPNKKGRTYWTSWLKSFIQVHDLTIIDERMALSVAEAHCLDFVNK